MKKSNFEFYHFNISKSTFQEEGLVLSWKIKSSYTITKNDNAIKTNILDGENTISIVIFQINIVTNVKKEMINSWTIMPTLLFHKRYYKKPIKY